MTQPPEEKPKEEPPVIVCPPMYAYGAVPSYVIKPKKKGKQGD